jgi:outer membrane protein TolC
MIFYKKQKRALAAVLLISALVVPASGRAAEEPQDTSLAAVLAGLSRHKDASGSQHTVQLNLRDAIRIALAANREVQLSEFNPLMAAAELKKTQTVYDPTFFSDTSYSRTDRPISSLLDNGTDGTTGKDALRENRWSTQTGLRQPLPTGGSATVAYESDHLNSNSDLVTPDPQYTSRLKVELRQALLKEIGDRTNKTNIELAELAVKQSASDHRKALNDILQELAQYYWRYKYFYELEQLSRKAVQEGEEILARLQTRQKQGIADLLDLDTADSSLQDRRVQLITDSKSTQTTLDQLKMLLGSSSLSEDFFAAIEPAEPFRTSVSIADKMDLGKTALTKREEVAMARRDLESAGIKKKLAAHLQLPTVDAKAGYWLNGLGTQWEDSFDGAVKDGQGSWYAGVVIEWPLGGRKGSLELEKADIAKRKARIQYQKVLEKILYEVHSSATEVKLSMAEVEAAEKAKTSYAKIVEREKTLFEMSRIDNQRILDTEDKYNDAARAYIRALFNLNTAFLKLQWAQGTLLESWKITI